jgi:hypothetical protein
MILLNDTEASASAPNFEPEIWNDLPLDAKENVRQFFEKLRKNHLNSVALLQSSGLFYLGAMVSLLEPKTDYPNVNVLRIRRLLSEEEVNDIIDLLNDHFSYQQTRANCYAYVLNFKKGTVGAKPDPGGKTSEYKCRLYDTYRDAIVDGAQEDGLIYAGCVSPRVRHEFYRVALFILEDNDDPSFHWLREDFGASAWSHKDGHGPVKNTDYAGNVIASPHSAQLGKYELRDFFYVPYGGIEPKFMYSGL